MVYEEDWILDESFKEPSITGMFKCFSFICFDVFLCQRGHIGRPYQCNIFNKTVVQILDLSLMEAASWSA